MWSRLIEVLFKVKKASLAWRIQSSVTTMNESGCEREKINYIVGEMASKKPSNTGINNIRVIIIVRYMSIKEVLCDPTE